MRAAADASVDVIIVDSTDPAGPGEVLFTEAFYRDCARVLTPGGLLVNQCGVPFMQADELRETAATGRVFATSLPTSPPCRPMSAASWRWAWREPAESSPVSHVRGALRCDAGVSGDARYWSPACTARVRAAALYRSALA